MNSVHTRLNRNTITFFLKKKSLTKDLYEVEYYFLIKTKKRKGTRETSLQRHLLTNESLLTNEKLTVHINIFKQIIYIYILERERERERERE